MKTLRCSRPWGRRTAAAARLAAWAVVMVLAAGPLAAAEKKPADRTGKKSTPAAAKKKDAQEQEQIRISAEQLITDGNARWAEFTGEVVATQGETRITSDRLKIFYREAPDKKGSAEKDSESIERIVANGNVKINYADRQAESQQAVYDPDNGTLVLTGEGSRVKQGENWISGQKITLHREGNRMQVEGGVQGGTKKKGKKKQRVEAVIFSKDKGLK